MRNGTFKIVGVLLASVGLVAASCLSSLDVWAKDRPDTDQSVKAADSTSAERTQGNALWPGVQTQFMRPGQLEAAARKFPVVVVPFGCVEWHGRHLPLGTEAIGKKARELLESLPKEHRAFRLESVSPGHWWMI